MLCILCLHLSKLGVVTIRIRKRGCNVDLFNSLDYPLKKDDVLRVLSSCVSLVKI